MVGPGASTYKGQPEKGDCWQATQAEAAEWMHWEGSRPVSCSDEHTLETVGVLPVEGDFYIEDGEYPDEYLDQAVALCEEAWADATGWAKKPNRFSNYLFYPTIEDFEAGEQWVRCDIGVTATGTLWIPEAFQLETLTQSVADIREAAKRDTNIVALCLDSESDEIGPLGELLTIADCDKSHRWTMVRATNLSLESDEKYPGDEEIERRAELSCTRNKPDAVKGTFWLPPSKAEWDDGLRISYCFWASVPTTSA
jgi:hypothetical protein